MHRSHIEKADYILDTGKLGIMILKNRRIIEQFKEPLFKNSLYLMLSSVSVSFFGFIFWIIIARYYSPSEVGLATAIFSASQLITTFSGLGLNFGVIQYLPKENDKNAIINSCLWASGLFSIIGTFVFIFGINYWSPALLFIREDNRFFFTFVILTIVSSVSILLNSIFIALRHADISLMQNIVSNVTRTLFPLLLISFGLLGIIISGTVSILISFIISCIFFIPKIQSGFRMKIYINRKIIEEILPFSFKNYIAGFFGSLPIMVIPLMIVNLLDKETAAYYYIAYSISSILSIVPVSVATSLLVEGTHDKNNFRSNVFKSTKIILYILIPLMLSLFLFGDKLLMLFGESYSRNALIPLWVFGISSFPIAVNQLYATVKRIQNNLNPLIYINIFIALFVIVLSYLLMNVGGLIGVGILWALANGLIALIIVSLTMKKLI